MLLKTIPVALSKGLLVKFMLCWAVLCCLPSKTRRQAGNFGFAVDIIYELRLQYARVLLLMNMLCCAVCCAVLPVEQDPNAMAGKFGFAVDNTIGATPQPNGWMDDWVEFYRERRIRHQLQLLGECCFKCLTVGKPADEPSSKLLRPVPKATIRHQLQLLGEHRLHLYVGV
jgi:hypothetical protein